MAAVGESCKTKDDSATTVKDITERSFCQYFI